MCIQSKGNTKRETTTPFNQGGQMLSTGVGYKRNSHKMSQFQKLSLANII